MKISHSQNNAKNKLLADASSKLSLISTSDISYSIKIKNKQYTWATNDEKISLIRKGLPYAAIETISKHTKIPVNHYLNSLEIVQTTYNKKKKSNDILSKQNSEFIFELIELYDFGLNVFNCESEKFQRWLRKPNISLGSTSPDSLFDSLTGIREVRKALNRIEFGNMA
ncbi:antitoxin Xre/MbcA/ParS toxin-binding domain-containing protein [Pricia sp.]|uniref:type II RES/Xre toxin-antitoxin system antitoxin n=1 Tax=Pricia sp. TaxID=2268138 RepID=UPI0035932560